MDDSYIRLDQFLKLKGLVFSGGEAKHLIQDGEVLLNGEICTQRSKKIRPGDVITLGDVTVPVEEADLSQL